MRSRLGRFIVTGIMATGISLGLTTAAAASAASAVSASGCGVHACK